MKKYRVLPALFLITFVVIIAVCLANTLTNNKLRSTTNSTDLITKSSQTLSLDYVKQIVNEKGKDNVSWEDFGDFKHQDVGSGNYVYQYELEDGSSLFLSGTSLKYPPQYIFIVDAENGRIDIKP